MATPKIEAAIKAIPSKKESLHKVFDILSSFSPPASFSLRWDDVEAHISSIEGSINARFQELQAKEAATPPPTSAPAEPEPTQCAKLVSVCASMDADGLRNLLANYRRPRTGTRNELHKALGSAPDPAMLVLEAIEETFTPQLKRDRKWMTCISLLECVHTLVDAGSINPFVIEKAKQLAVEWKGKIYEIEEEDGLAASAVLNLLLSYGLASKFEADEVIDLFARASFGKMTVELCRDLGLAERVPDLVDILMEMGRQLDAIEFIYAFNLSEKYPIVSLLKAYVEKIVKAVEMLEKGEHSKIKRKARLRNIADLRSVLKTIKVHNLESEYPPHVLEKEITRLQQYKNNTCTPAVRTRWNSKPQHHYLQQWEQQQRRRQWQHQMQPAKPWKQQQKQWQSQHQNQQAKLWRLQQKQPQEQQQNPAKRRRPSASPTSPAPATTRFLPAIQNTAPAAIPIVLGPVYDMGTPGSLYIPSGPPGVPGVQPVLIALPPGPYQYLPDPSGSIGQRLR